MKLAIIASVSENGIVGQGDKIPWKEMFPKIKEHVLKMVKGNYVIFGRKTYENYCGDKDFLPISGCKNIIISRNRRSSYKKVFRCDDLDQAMKLVQASSSIGYILGGASLFNGAINLVNCINLIIIHKKYVGNYAFPEFNISKWDETFKKKLEFNNITYTCISYNKKLESLEKTAIIDISKEKILDTQIIKVDENIESKIKSVDYNLQSREKQNISRFAKAYKIITDEKTKDRILVTLIGKKTLVKMKYYNNAITIALYIMSIIFFILFITTIYLIINIIFGSF